MDLCQALPSPHLPLMVVNIPHVGFLPLFDFTPVPIDLGRLAVGRSDLTGVCEAESVCDGVNVMLFRGSLPW